MKIKSICLAQVIIALAFLFGTNTANAEDLTGSVFSGQAKSSKSGQTWNAILRIVSYDKGSGRVEGELEWPSLNSVHKIVGQLSGSQLSFKEVEYIKQGGAKLNCEYTATCSNGEISGTWVDPGYDNGTFQLSRKANPATAKQNDDFAGSVFSGQAKSSKSGQTWPANLKIVSYDPGTGRVEGQIEWTSLNSINKIVGQLSGSRFTFKEVDYIKKGSAVLNGEYDASYSNGEISGTWSDPSDKGTFVLSRKSTPVTVKQNDDFTGSVFSGQARSSKSGSTWPTNLKIVSYDPGTGRVEGQMEWPSLNSINKIVGQFSGSRLTFKEVDYIKKGSAVLNGEYDASYSNGEISGTWSDPSDKGTFMLSRKSTPITVKQNDDFTGSVFSGQAKSSKSGSTWPANLKIVSYNQATGRVEGEIEWTSLNSINKIVGQLSGSRFTFKEVEYIKRGGAVLNCEYDASYLNGEISGTWADPGSDKGTFLLTKK